MAHSNGRVARAVRINPLLVVITDGPDSKPRVGLAANCGSIMATTVSSVVFDDIFTINAIDKEGKKFDRGMRSFESDIL